MPPKNIQRTLLHQALSSIFSSLKNSVVAVHGGWGMLTGDVPIEKLPDFNGDYGSQTGRSMWQHLTPSHLQKKGHRLRAVVRKFCSPDTISSGKLLGVSSTEIDGSPQVCYVSRYLRPLWHAFLLSALSTHISGLMGSSLWPGGWERKRWSTIHWL